MAHKDLKKELNKKKKARLLKLQSTAPVGRPLALALGPLSLAVEVAGNVANAVQDHTLGTKEDKQHYDRKKQIQTNAARTKKPKKKANTPKVKQYGTTKGSK